MIRYIKKNQSLIAITGILLMGAVLRFYNISCSNLLHDSASSLEASLAISKYNIPLLPSGIWYSRSPFYHYFLGFCIKIQHFIAPRDIGRCITAFFSLICCFEVYLLGAVMGNKRAGLVGAFLTSVNPFFIYMSRVIRFYSVATAVGTLTIICFYRGFILEEQNYKYKIATFIFLPVTFLLGEVTATVVPGTAICYLLFCEKPDASSIKIIITGTICFLAAVVADMALLYSKCRTPYIAMNISTSPQIMPHLKNPFNNIAVFFIGDYQTNLIITFFVGIAIIWIIIQKNKNFFVLFLILIISVFIVQILVLLISQRYFFHLLPFYYLTAGFGCERTLNFMFCNLYCLYPQKTIFSPAKIIFAVMIIIPLLFALYSDIQPKKLSKSYNIDPILNTKSEDAVKFVKSHMLEKDVLITPFGEIATVYDLKVQYYLLRIGYFDEIFYQDGKIIERQSGAVCIDNADKMLEVIKRHNRIWIVYKDNSEFDEKMVKLIKKVFSVKAMFGDVYVSLWDIDATGYKRIGPMNNYHKCYF